MSVYEKVQRARVRREWCDFSKRTKGYVSINVRVLYVQPNSTLGQNGPGV